MKRFIHCFHTPKTGYMLTLFGGFRHTVHLGVSGALRTTDTSGGKAITVLGVYRPAARDGFMFVAYPFIVAIISGAGKVT